MFVADTSLPLFSNSAFTSFMHCISVSVYTISGVAVTCVLAFELSAAISDLSCHHWHLCGCVRVRVVQVCVCAGVCGGGVCTGAPPTSST